MSEPSESFPGLSGGIKSHAARVIVTRLAGSVGEYENARLMDAVCEVIMRDPPSRIVIEMSRVTECDQQLVATLVLCKDLARDAGSELVIARPSADALALIRGAQLERSIRVYPDESSAVSVEPETLDPLQPVPQARAQDDSDVAGVVDPVIDSITGFFSPHYMRRWLSDAGENARCACSMVLLELPHPWMEKRH